jgi:hypothetical protein
MMARIMSPLFFTYNNIANLLTQSSFTGLLALGMTFVILVGCFGGKGVAPFHRIRGHAGGTFQWSKRLTRPS